MLLWPEQIKINDKLLMLRKGVCNNVTISVVNSSQHDVVLPGSTRMGRLELVSSVTPVEVQRKNVEVSKKMSEDIAVVESCTDNGGGDAVVCDSSMSEALVCVDPDIGGASGEAVENVSSECDSSVSVALVRGVPGIGGASVEAVKSSNPQYFPVKFSFKL